MCCTREAFRNLPASAARRCCCLRRAQHAASAELSTATIDTSRQLQRWLAATPASGRVVPRRFGSTHKQGARRLRAALLLTCPPRHAPCRCASAHHAHALAGAQSATRRTVAAAHQLGLALQVALSVQIRSPPSLSPSLTSAFSPVSARRERKLMNTVSYS